MDKELANLICDFDSRYLAEAFISDIQVYGREQSVVTATAACVQLGMKGAHPSLLLGGSTPSPSTNFSKEATNV